MTTEKIEYSLDAILREISKKNIHWPIIAREIGNLAKNTRKPIILTYGQRTAEYTFFGGRFNTETDTFDLLKYLNPKRGMGGAGMMFDGEYLRSTDEILG